MKIIYVANDKTEFSDESECIEYELSLKLKEVLSTKKVLDAIISDPNITVKKLIENFSIDFYFDWNTIDPIYDYVAMDYNGKWFAYVNKPYVANSRWMCTGNYVEVDFGDYVHHNWMGSLFERPEKVEKKINKFWRDTKIIRFL